MPTPDHDHDVEQKPTWTFLTNHAHVLVSIANDPDARLRDIATQVGITERAAQTIVADLEAEGYVVRSRVGRRNHYQVTADKPLRHPLERHREVGALLAILREDATPTARHATVP
jgi:predicted ArsR family transcriptional regulator